MKKWITSKSIRIVNLFLVGVFLLGLPTQAASLNISSNQNPSNFAKSNNRSSDFPANQIQSELISVADQNMERISQYGGWVKNFHVSGNRATLCVNSRIEILEFYVFGRTKIIGQTELQEPCEVLVSTNEFAYVAGSTGVMVLNISDPHNISQVDFIVATGPFKEIIIDGEYLYLNNYSSVVIYSLTNPSEPLYIGTYYSGSSILSFTISNNYMYVAKGINGAVVIDISDKSNPIQVGDFYYIGSASSIAIIGNYAYVSDNTEGTQHGLQIFDITYPHFPGIYEIITIPASQKVYAAGNVAYLMSDNLYLLDISIPSNPIIASTLELPDLAILSGDRLYNYKLTDEFSYFPLGLFSEVIVSDPYQPDQIGLYKYKMGAWGISKKDNYVYFASDIHGLHIIDISDPELPYWVSSVDLPGRAGSVTINGNYAYVASGPDGLYIVDISSPDFPSLEGVYDTAGSVSDVNIIGDLAFLATGSGGLIIINISNPANPTFVGQYNSNGTAGSLDVYGDYAYIADGDNGLNIINIANPSSPYFVKSFDTTYRAEDVLVSGSIVYLTENEGGESFQGWLRIIDVSNPSQPTQLGVVSEVQITDITKEGNIIFGTDYFGYLRAYDVTNPSQPLEVGFSEPYPPLWGLVVDQFKIFAVGYDGMFVVDYTGGGGGGDLFEDVRQAGEIVISGNLVEGGTVYLTIPVKNFGTAPSPPIHPYTEGYTSLNQLWRADGAVPTAKIIDPGETINFTVQHDLWYGHVGLWTTYGVYLWNDEGDSYYGELLSNDFDQTLEFEVIEDSVPTHDIDLSVYNSSLSLVKNDSFNVYNRKGSQPNQIVLKGSISNFGEDQANNVTLNLWDGQPPSGTMISSTKNIAIKPKDTKEVAIELTIHESRKDTDLFIEVVSDPSQPDKNLSNNVSSKGIGLFVAYADYEYDPDTFNFPNWSMTLDDFLNSLTDFYLKKNVNTAVRYMYSYAVGPFWYVLTASGGHCYGMSGASIIYWDTPSVKPISIDTYLMDKVDSVLRDIRDHHVRQLFPVTGTSITERIAPDISSPTRAYETLKNILDKSNPTPMILALNGHAVVGYKVVEIGNEKTIFTYENRSPLNPSYSIYPDIFVLDENNDEFNTNRGQTFNWAVTLPPLRDVEEISLELIEDIAEYLMGILDQQNKSSLLFSFETSSAMSSSSINMLDSFYVTDIFGRKTGYLDGVKYLEIPGVEFSEWDTSLHMLLPEDLEYSLTIQNGQSIVRPIIGIAVPASSTSQGIVFTDFSIPQNQKATSTIGKDVAQWSIEIEGQQDIYPTYETSFNSTVHIYIPFMNK